MNLDGKRILVTGAAGGIGLATAHVLAEAGARLAIVDLDEAKITSAASEFQAGKATPIVADVSSSTSIEGMFKKAEEALGGLDGIFNNAGIMPPEDRDISETEEDTWDRVISVNLKSVYLCCRFGIPILLKAGGGAIVNNASIVALLGSFPSQIAYTASKGGVLAMTRELGVGYARRGIRVNAVLPGVTKTSMAAQIVSDNPDQNDLRRLQHIPAGRYATPDEIGHTVAFLLSDAASYITAQGWSVDGGLTGAYLCPDNPVEGS